MPVEQLTEETVLTDENAGMPRLTIFQKFVYGSGDWSRASFNTLRQIFYAIFLTDVVGLDPRLASMAAFVSVLWDAINDPLVGSLSDRVHTRWGRRRPFLIIFALPFTFAFLVLWWAPPWQSQIAVAVTVTLAYMLSDTVQTLVTVPYLALTPEIAPGYDERTNLTGLRMFFNLLASLVTAVAAPMIVQSSLKAGLTLQQGYLTVAAMFGALAAIPYLLIFFVIRERNLERPEQREEKLTFRQTLDMLWANTPFRFAAGIYVLNWIAFDIVALMLPYFLIYWVGRGDLLIKVHLLGSDIALASVVLGLLMITATASLPLWTWVSGRLSKRDAYILGMGFWIVVQLLVLAIQPGQIGLILGLAVLAGISVSTAHVMPESIFPDVIDWDELRTNRRREGMYYGTVNFVRKLSSAFAIFLALQVLGWFGYQAPPVNVTAFAQSSVTLGAIRTLTGPVVAVLLLSAVGIAWFYPLSRERQTRIRLLLARRQALRRQRSQGRASSAVRL